MCVLSTFSNIFSSDTIGPIEPKFHVEPPWEEGMKVCSNGPGNMTKMATMPIYGKNLKNSSPDPKGRWPWHLVFSIECMRTTTFVQMMTLGWPGPILRQLKVKFGPLWFCMEKKGKTMEFSETIVVCDLKLATDDRSDKKFLLTSKLCPQGAVCPLPRGYIHVLNHEKKW